MEGNFKEGEVGYYTVKLFELIEDFDPDQYNNRWYNVLFEGDAETFMWLKKEVPVEGQKYYGHLEKTKSGKRLRFKTDKLPEGTKAPVTGGKSVADYEPSTNTRWAIGMAYRAFIQVTGSPEGSSGEFPFGEVKQHATELLRMFDELKNSGSLDAMPTPSSAIKEETAPATGLAQARSTANRIKGIDEPPEDMP